MSNICPSSGFIIGRALNATRVSADSCALSFVYVGLVMAYGAIGFTQSAITAEWIRHGLIGVVTASALLHFYYDGFIWKVREAQTRTMLGIEGAGATALASPRFWPAWVRHSLRWAALVIPPV